MTTGAMLNQNKINKIFTIFDANNSEPKTELVYKNNYTLLISVVLSAQATDKGVNLATKSLFEKYDTPEKILSLGLEGLKQYVKTINYYPTKAKNIIGLSEILIKNYNSVVPDNLEDLIMLPGVGRKTANVVIGAGFGKAAMPVDTHVFRVATRLGIGSAKTPTKMEHELVANIPKKWLYNAHHWLVLHGRYICKARKPLCEECLVKEYCDYYSSLRGTLATKQSTKKHGLPRHALHSSQ
jgi:endonuclease-3